MIVSLDLLQTYIEPRLHIFFKTFHFQITPRRDDYSHHVNPNPSIRSPRGKRPTNSKLHPKLHPDHNQYLTPLEGIPLPPRPRSKRTPNPHRLHRPLRQRPALLQPPSQRRHPSPRAPLLRPRVRRDRLSRRLRRLKLQERRQSRPRSRPSVWLLCPLH